MPFNSYRTTAHYPNLKLVCAGEGNDSEWLKKQIHARNLNGKIQIVGKISGKAKIEMLANCLFLVMPSRYESWGMAALEASAAQKAVVGFNISGLNYVVKNNVTGILVPLGNEKAFSDAVKGLLENKEKRIRLGLEGMRWAGLFSWDKIAQQQEEFYNYIARK